MGNDVEDIPLKSMPNYFATHGYFCLHSTISRNYSTIMNPAGSQLMYQIQCESYNKHYQFKPMVANKLGEITKASVLLSEQ